MLTANRSLLFFFYAAAFTLFALAQDTPMQSFRLGDQIELSLNKSDFIYYKFRVDDVSPKYDLSMIARPRGDNDPELFLSTTEQHPNSKANSEYYSTSFGYSSIYIPFDEIKANTDYYLGVGCSTEVCEFMLTVDYAQEYYMREQVEDVIIDYVHGGTVVIRMYVPNRTTIDHILLSAEVETQAETDQGVKMYVNKGNEIPSSSKSDVIALDAWKDGKAANIFRGDSHFCVDCNYTIIVEAVRKSKVTFRRTFYGEQIPLELNHERNDAVELGAYVTYAVNISKFDVLHSFIMVEVTPYFGRAKVLANLETAPEKLEDYKFSFTGHGQELLSIPVQVKPSNNMLYVTVNGTTYSTYTIKVYTVGKKNMVLRLNEPEFGYILDTDVESFLLVSSGRKNMKMTFTLHPEQGKVNLFVKTCKEKDGCSFTKNEVKNILDGTTPTSIKTPIIQYSNATDGDETINIEMDGSTCESSGSAGTPTCYFSIGVLGIAQGVSKFTLTATRADLPQALRVSRPVKEHLSLDQYRYYYFTVGNDKNVESVNFQITKISGFVDIYISRKSKYPDARDKEEFHHYNDFYSFERANFPVLNGTYYIAIKAFTSATFSIVPIVKYNTDASNLGGHHLVKLVEGIPQKTVLDNGEPAYFKFDAFISETASQGLEITLDEVQGHFIICATTNNELPTLDNCQFKSINNSLVITKDDAGFDPLGTYLVVVFPKPVKQEDGENTGAFNKKAKVQSFSITWAALHRYRIASFGLPLMNWVNSKRSLYYKIEVHPSEDKEIVIHKATTTATSSSQINLYLANVETKLGHNVSVFNPDMVVNTTDTLKLKQSDIENLCEDTTSDFKCYLYLAVTTASEDDISFTITITKDFDDLRISESVEATYSFPTSGHPLHLYYYPHRLEDITILAHTFGRNITLYANVINTRDHSSRGTWNFPTNRTHEFIARNSMSHIGESRLHIPAAELSSCGADYDKFRCGIAMTLIYGEADKEQFAGINYKDFGLFSILANQEITPIAAGKPIHTSVGEGAYAYFSLSVNKDQATLMISANVLSGQHVVVLASKGKDARPTIESAEFRTYYGKMETLQVSGEETLQGTARGDWVIAVYGNTQTEFVLNVIYENTKMVELHRGLPVNVDVNKDPIFFEYYHEVDSSFEFKIAKQRGAGKISIKYYLENETAADNLPTEHSGPIVRPFNNFQNVILISNRSEHFCKGCLYIVGIFPHTAMKVSLVTQIPGQFIFLQDNQIFADSASPSTENKYEHIARIHDVIDINFVVYSGEPHIYISHNPTVNSTNYLWSYTQVSSNNYIRMRLNNTEYMNQAILDPVFDGARNVSSYKNIYYIMVTAPIDANYSIAVSVSNSSRSLIDGHLDFGFLNPGEYNLYKYHVSKDNIESGMQNRLKLQFTLHKDQFFTTLKEGELTRPNIVVMSVPHKSYNNASINKAGLLPDLPVLAPIRQDELERSYGDQHFTMNLLYQAPGDQDFYVVVNNSESNRHLNYSIVANSHEPVYLTLNNFHASRLTVGESEVYAVHAAYPGLLVIEIHECQGQVVVQTSNSPNFVTKPVEEYTVDVKTNNPAEGEKIDDETFTGKSSDEASTGGPQFHELLASSMGSQIKTADITIDQEQTIYILVRGWDGVRDDDSIQDLQAVYKIRVGLHPLRNFMPFKNLQPGYDGLLTWDVPSSGKLKLEFGDVKNLAVADKAIKSTKFGNLAIQYHYEAIFTKRPEMGSYLAKCDMLPKPQGIYKGLDMYRKSVTFDQSSLVDVPNHENGKSVVLETDDIPEQYVTLKVTAVGVDANGTAVWDYPIIYKTTEVKTGTTILGVRSSTFLVVLLVVCMVMLVAAIGGMYYYYKKFQRVRAKLNYEMQDLRNIANTVESFDTLDDDRDKSGYAGLIGKE